MPVAIASFCWSSIRYSFPPLDIFLNSSNSWLIPFAITPPFDARAGGASLISVTIFSTISLQGLRESPRRCKYSLWVAAQISFMEAVCNKPRAICNTSRGFTFFNGTLLTSLSTSPACFTWCEILFLISASFRKYSTVSSRSFIFMLSFSGSTIQRFNRRAPIGETVLSNTFNKVLLPSAPPNNSKLRMVNRSIHKCSSRSIL